MGHTIVAGFQQESTQMLYRLTQGHNANKIPFGRNCDREAANRVLDYHMTLFHWGKAEDSLYLPRLEHFSSTPFELLVTGAKIRPARENSRLLYLQVQPTPSYRNLAGLLEAQLQAPTSGFLHITLAISKDLGEIRALYEDVCRRAAFPLTLTADRLDLYHIWTPTVKVRSF